MAEMHKTVQTLVPAGDKTAAVFVAKSLHQFGIPENWADIAIDFIEELSEIPADLLEESWRHIRRTCRFFPKIVDFIEPIQDELSARRYKAMRLQLVLNSIAK